ncbi:MAG TPA: chromate efflux transporter [Candidatus Binataceae bacterium]|nr:chromate efflux transporter [Candidatus Binataceae bacterium]
MDLSLSGIRSLVVESDRVRELVELMRLFFRLGVTAFGGPAAHIAMMEDEVVRRRQWLTREAFLDMISACNLIPGPNSTEMAIHIGHRRAGFVGLLVAGISFIVPAASITIVLAWAYVRFGHLPTAAGVLYGIKPVIIAVVLQAIWRLGRVALHTPTLILLAIVATAAAFFGVDEMIVLLGAGVLAILTLRMREGLSAVVAASATAVKAGAATAAPFALGALFLIFLKIGAVLFGSGYVLLAFLQADLVDRTHWLTQAQLLDAVAVGQFTPGPVFTTATFVGYLLGGNLGALAATIGIFLPAFFFVSISGPLLPVVRRSRLAGAFLDGVNAGSFALMVVVTWQLGRTAIVDWPTLALAVASAVLLLRFRLNSAWLVIGGGSIGALLTLAH